MSDRRTIKEVYAILLESIYKAYIAEVNYQKYKGYISSLGTVYYSEAIDRWTREYLPELIEKHFSCSNEDFQFFDGGGFNNGYEGANITIEGYNFNLKSAFDRAKYL